MPTLPVKKVKPSIVVPGLGLLELDSEDEVLMVHWLMEAESAGDIPRGGWERVTEKTLLTPAVSGKFYSPPKEKGGPLQVKTRTAFGDSTYGADFRIRFVPDILSRYPGICSQLLIPAPDNPMSGPGGVPGGYSPDGWLYVDVKPPRDKGKILQIAFLRMKILYDRTGMFTHPIIVDEFFRGTFAPRSVALKPGGGVYAKYRLCQVRGLSGPPGGLKMPVSGLM